LISLISVPYLLNAITMNVLLIIYVKLIYIYICSTVNQYIKEHIYKYNKYLADFKMHDPFHSTKKT